MKILFTVFGLLFSVTRIHIDISGYQETPEPEKTEIGKP
jgi:hypothetical protein